MMPRPGRLRTRNMRALIGTTGQRVESAINPYATTPTAWRYSPPVSAHESRGLLLLLFCASNGWRLRVESAGCWPNGAPRVVRLLIGNLTVHRFVVIVNLLRMVGAINGCVAFRFLF